MTKEVVRKGSGDFGNGDKGSVVTLGSGEEGSGDEGKS